MNEPQTATLSARVRRATDSWPLPGGRVRVYEDARGVTWRVCEYAGGQSRSLVFASPDVMRRVTYYPADWWTLSDAELAKLSWRR